MKPDAVTYQVGIPDEHRSVAVDLFDEAFGEKLALAVPNREKRKALFVEGFNLDSAIAALVGGNLVGIAGFHAHGKSLTSGLKYRHLLSHLGFLGGNRAAIVFSLFERTPRPNELVMDGIAVQSQARGMGIGKRLLGEIRTFAQIHGFNRVRLDVIDTNPKARKLYERFGFTGVKTERFPQLKSILGFGGVTTMELRI